jgi:cellulose biosynthesis protein BcsQ
MLLLSDLALLPISPSILDLRSVQQASGILRFAQQINVGRPDGRLILNKMRTRDTISRELRTAAPQLGVSVASTIIRDLQAYRDAAQQGTTVTRMGRKGAHAREEIVRLFTELVPQSDRSLSNKEVANG